jgi:hypothetical protein
MPLVGLELICTLIGPVSVSASAAGAAIASAVRATINGSRRRPALTVIPCLRSAVETTSPGSI